MARIFLKIFNLFNKKEKFNYLILLFLIIVSSIIDLFGIASIFPFIFLISNPNIIESNQLINFFYNSLINLGVIQNQTNFLFLSGILTSFLLIISIVFRTLSQSLIIRFCLNFEKTMNLSLVKNYLTKPYIYFLDKNSSDIYKKIITQTRDTVDKVIFPSVNLISHSVIILIIMLFLIYFNSHVFFNTFSFLFIFFFLFYYVFRKKFRAKGQIKPSIKLKEFKCVI